MLDADEASEGCPHHLPEAISLGLGDTVSRKNPGEGGGRVSVSALPVEDLLGWWRNMEPRIFRVHRWEQ